MRLGVASKLDAEATDSGNPQAGHSSPVLRSWDDLALHDGGQAIAIA
jgi:hypothetical protein